MTLPAIYYQKYNIMDQFQSIYGMIIGLVAVVGGLGIGFFAVRLGVTAEARRKMAEEEARHKERLALIEKGMDPLLADKKLPKDYTQGALLWGMLLAGIGLGVFIGNFIPPHPAGKPDLVTNALGLFFGGLGLLSYYSIRTRRGTAVKQTL